jgi:prevent-host-death family protein
MGSPLPIQLSLSRRASVSHVDSKRPRGIAATAGKGYLPRSAKDLETIMAAYSIAEAQDKLSELVDAANAGEAVTLTRSGKPVAVLKPAGEGPRAATPEMLELLAGARALWPRQGDDAATLVRKMRDEVR